VHGAKCLLYVDVYQDFTIRPEPTDFVLPFLFLFTDSHADGSAPDKLHEVLAFLKLEWLGNKNPQIRQVDMLSRHSVQTFWFDPVDSRGRDIAFSVAVLHNSLSHTFPMLASRYREHTPLVPRSGG